MGDTGFGALVVSGLGMLLGASACGGNVVVDGAAAGVASDASPYSPVVSLCVSSCAAYPEECNLPAATCQAYPFACEDCAVLCVDTGWSSGYYDCGATFSALTTCVSSAPSLGCHNDACVPELAAYTTCTASACGAGDPEYCVTQASYWTSCSLDAESHPGCSAP